MGPDEPPASEPTHELGVVIDGIGRTQEVANDVLATARTLMLHSEVGGRLYGVGNMAFPYSPSDLPVGPVYCFSIWRLLKVDDPCAIFPWN
jgi:hypothetical protein